jgi:hypothetical protein
MKSLADEASTCGTFTHTYDVPPAFHDSIS